jgi:hypothetical protein
MASLLHFFAPEAIVKGARDSKDKGKKRASEGGASEEKEGPAGSSSSSSTPASKRGRLGAASTGLETLWGAKWTATFTFSHSTESHAGSTIHGRMAKHGFNLQDLHTAIEWAGTNSVEHELVELHTGTGTSRRAHVLILRNAIPALMGAEEGTRSFADEFKTDIWPHLDRKKVVNGKVYKKDARGNCEIGPTRLESELATLDVGEFVSGRVTGLVLPYCDLATTSSIRDALPQAFGAKAEDLRCECNYYGPPHGATPDEVKKTDVKKCGIGFHGGSSSYRVQHNE